MSSGVTTTWASSRKPIAMAANRTKPIISSPNSILIARIWAISTFKKTMMPNLVTGSHSGCKTMVSKSQTKMVNLIKLPRWGLLTVRWTYFRGCTAMLLTLAPWKDHLWTWSLLRMSNPTILITTNRGSTRLTSSSEKAKNTSTSKLTAGSPDILILREPKIFNPCLIASPPNLSRAKVSIWGPKYKLPGTSGNHTLRAREALCLNLVAGRENTMLIRSVSKNKTISTKKWKSPRNLWFRKSWSRSNWKLSIRLIIRLAGTPSSRSQISRIKNLN